MNTYFCSVGKNQGCQTWELIPRSWEFLKVMGIFLEVIFSKKPWDKSWDYRNCSVKFFAFVSVVLFIATFLISESQNKCLMEPHRAVI